MTQIRRLVTVGERCTRHNDLLHRSVWSRAVPREQEIMWASVLRALPGASRSRVWRIAPLVGLVSVVAVAVVVPIALAGAGDTLLSRGKPAVASSIEGG